MSVSADPTARRSITNLVLGLAVVGSVVVLVAGFLPWRADELSDPQSLLRVSRRAPLVLVGYLLVAALVLATTLLAIVSSGRRIPILVLAATGVALALVTFLAVPLPSGHAIGATPDGRMIEFDLPSHRFWGCYLTLAGSLLCFGSAVLRTRLAEPLLASASRKTRLA